MRAAPRSVPIETLIQQRGWMRGLAQRLVHDDGLADDAVQDAWLAGLEAGGGPAAPLTREPAGLRAWLSRVVRNKSIDRQRAERTRRRHEDAAAPPTAPRSPAEVIADAEAHERVVRAVLGLDEPYRSTILLRYFEDRPPREVAATMDVPVETVRTRTRRALGRLRETLDETHGGGRAVWVAALIPLTGVRDAAPALSSLTLGVIVMGLKTKVTAVAAAAALLIGLGLGYLGGAAAAESDGPGNEVENLSARLASAQTKAEGLDADVASARSDARAVQQELASTREQLAEAQREQASLAEAHTAALARATAAEERLGDQAAPPARYAAARYPVLDQVDWETVGQSVSELLPLIDNLVAAFREGRQLPPGEISEIQNRNVPLMGAAMKIAGQISGEGINGSYASPAFLANLMDATLRAADIPLTIAQSDELARLVEEALQRETELTTTYDDRTLLLRRMYDQIESRTRFSEAAFALLSTEQVQLLRPDAFRGRVTADIFDPSVQWGLFVRPMWHSGKRSSLGRDIYRDFIDQVKPAEELRADIEAAVEEWSNAIPDELVEQTSDGLEKAGYGRATDVRRSARHAIELYEQVARDLPLSQEALGRLRMMPGPPLVLRRP